MPDAEKTQLLSRAKDEAGDGCHELFKTAYVFDSTIASSTDSPLS